ncbi:MAG: hypothetical protein V3W28_04370 [Thermoplasmata archaeon]
MVRKGSRPRVGLFIEARGVGERFIDHLRRKGKGYLAKALRIVISKIVDLPSAVIPLWNLVGEDVDSYLDRATIFVDGSE